MVWFVGYVSDTGRHQIRILRLYTQLLFQVVDVGTTRSEGGVIHDLLL